MSRDSLGFVVSLILLAVALVRVQAACGELDAAVGRSRAIVALQLSRTPQCARAVLQAAGSVDPLPIARRVVHREAVMIVGYVASAVFLGRIFAHALRKRKRTFTPLLVTLPLLAGLFDTAENCGLELFLADPGKATPLTTATVAVASVLKFAAMGCWLLALLVAAVIYLQQRWRRIPGTACTPIALEQAVAQETAYLAARRQQAKGGGPQNSPQIVQFPPSSAAATPLEQLADRPIGLALSGGGIRSATFNLGVLQALCKLELLPLVDYVSSVSGGGYIASCLSSLLSRREISAGEVVPDANRAYAFASDGTTRARFDTTPARFPFNPESQQQPSLGQFDGAAQIRYLRTHGNYLITRMRLFSVELLRTVGNVLGGLFYHLLLVLLLLVGISGLYLGLAEWIAGDLGLAWRPGSFGDYLRLLFANPSHHGAATHPLVVSLLYGAATALTAFVLFFASWRILRWVSPTFGSTPGQSVEETRENWLIVTYFSFTLVVAAWVCYAHVTSDGRREVDHLVLPFGIYLGGQFTALVLHGIGSKLPFIRRNARSRFSAVHGVFNYLTIASVLVLLAPWVIRWVAESGTRAATSVGGWLVTVGLTRWLAARRSPAASGATEPLFSRLVRRFPTIFKLTLSLLVVSFICGGVVLVCAALVWLQPVAGANPHATPFMLGLMAIGLFIGLGVSLDFNRLAMHYFYRDRLAETYLQTYVPESGASSAHVLMRDDAEICMPWLHGRAIDEDSSQPMQCVTSSPYHIVVAALNLTASRDMTRRDRKSDHFEFAKLFCGSDTTGFIDSRRYRSGVTRLAKALAISGAAASPTMGGRTFLAESLALTVFNVRLGQWVENPRFKQGELAHRTEAGVFWPYYLLREMLGSTDANRRLVYLSDGGHTGDNLGIVPLLKRRCAVIIASDAEADPARNFGSLSTALRQAYVDLNVKIDLDVEALRPDPAGLSQTHCAVGWIRYPATATLPEQEGFLLVLKSSVTGDELARLANYRRAHSDFPHESTGDQFFDDDQFESYRELGYHVAKRSLEKISNTAWRSANVDEWRNCWNNVLEAMAAKP